MELGVNTFGALRPAHHHMTLPDLTIGSSPYNSTSNARTFKRHQ